MLSEKSRPHYYISTIIKTVKIKTRNEWKWGEKIMG